MWVAGDEHAKIMAAHSQGARLTGGLQELQQNTQNLEILFLKLFHILFPELQQALSKSDDNSEPDVSAHMPHIIVHDALKVYLCNIQASNFVLEQGRAMLVFFMQTDAYLYRPAYSQM